MKLNKNKNIIVFTLVILTLTFAFLCPNIVVATARPSVSISNIGNCNQGDSISFSVIFSGSNLVNGGNVPFSTSYVVLHGFSADVGVIKNKYGVYTVTLNNINGSSGSNYVEIKSGAAIANDGLGSAASAATTSNSFSISSGDTVSPSISAIGPNVAGINNGGTITYIVRYTDASGVTNVNLYKNSIKLNGFTANVTVSGSGQNSKVVERKITLSNIQGTNGNKYITIIAATASDYAGNRTRAINSSTFYLTNKSSNANNTTTNTTNQSNDKVQENTENKTENSEDKKDETTTENKEETTKPSDWIENPKTGKY